MTSAPLQGGRLPAVIRVLPEPTKRHRAPRKWPAGLVLLAGAMMAVAGAALAGPLAAPTPNGTEAHLVANAAELARDGFTPFAHWGSDTTAAIQLAVALLVHGSADGLVAARFGVLAATAVTVLLTGALARRFGLTVPATALTTVATAALPWALDAHRLALPVNVALPWLLAAALFASPNARRRLAAAPAVLCLAIAIATEPLVAPAALLTGAVLFSAHDLAIGWNRTARVILGVLLGALALAAMVALSRNQAAPLVDANALDLVLLALATVSAAVGTIVRWLRPFAVVTLAYLGLALLVPDARTSAMLIALPAGAIVLGAAVDAARGTNPMRRIVRPLVPRALRPYRLTRIAILAVAILVVGGVLTVNGPAAGAGSLGPARAVAWARAEAGDATLVVDDAVWTAAGDSDGLPDRGRVVRYRDLDADRGAVGASVLLIGNGPGNRAPVRDAWRRSVLLASFDRTEVRLVVPDSYRTGAVADRVDRIDAATALAERTPGLHLTPAATAALTTGQVDGRLLILLTALAGGHNIDVDALPAVPGERGPYSLLRRARIVSIDGEPVTPSSAGTRSLEGWLGAQVPPYRPSTSVSDDGLTLRYPAPSHLSLPSD